MIPKNYLSLLAGPLSLLGGGGILLLAGCDGDEKPGVLGALPDALGGAGGEGVEAPREGGGAAGAGAMGGAPSGGGLCDAVTCGDHELCHEEGSGAFCACAPGFSGSPCVDLDECQTPSICGENSACVNYPGGYDCECALGYAFSDGECIDVDECDASISLCDESADCDNAPGTFICTCDPGLYGDGTFCRADDPCALDPCGSGECHPTWSGYACECPLGTSGSHCEDTCVMDEAISFESPVLAAAIGDLLGKSGDIYPADFVGHSVLYVAPPDTDGFTDDAITSLDGLECWPTLTELDLRGHPVSDLGALRSLGSLETLNLDCSVPEDLEDLSGLSRLRELSMSRTSLCIGGFRPEYSLAPLSDLSRLKRLAMNGFGLLSETDQLYLPRLAVAELRFSEISNFGELSGLMGVREFDLAQNSFEDLDDFPELPFLQKLDLSASLTGKLGSVDALSGVVDLRLDSCELSDVESLSELEGLRRLSVANNELEDVSDLAELGGLVSLELQGNQIESISAFQAASFAPNTLFIFDNPLDCSASEETLELLLRRGTNVISSCQP